MANGNGNGLTSVWRRLPQVYRTLIVIGLIFVAGFAAATTVWGLQDERTLYKDKVDTNEAQIDSVASSVSDMKPALRYLICAVVQSESEQTTAGCETAVQGTEWAQVIRDARRGR